MLILFYITAVAFILGQIARVQFPNGISVTFIDAAVGVFAVSWLALKLYKKEHIKHKLFVPVLLFFAVGFVALVFNSSLLTLQQFLVSLLYGLRWLTYALLFFAIRDFTKKDTEKVSRALIWTGGAVVVIGFLQYFFYNSLRNLFYLQWDDHLYRMFSIFLDPNFAGVFYVMYLLFIVGKITDTDHKSKRNTTVFYSILSFLTLIAIVLTYSRTALVAFIVGAMTLFLLKANRKAIFYLTIAAVVFVLLFSNIWVEGRNPFRSVSTAERIRSMHIAWEIIQKNPVIGVGFNAYRYAQNRYGFRTSEKWQISHADAGTDNSLLFVLATTGIVGFSVFLFFLYRIYKVIVPKGLQDLDVRQRGAFASFVALLASSFFLNTLFYPMLLYWFWVMLGTTENN